MDTAVLVGLLSASAAVVAAAISYYATKTRDREVEWRRQQLTHYKELFAAISGIVAADADAEAQRRFARACNTLGLIAPQPVMRALYEFQQASKQAGGLPLDEHDRILSALVLAIRQDLGTRHADDPAFRYHLWASGVGPR